MDTIGPGTPAWKAFDNAVIAWRMSNSSRDRAYKRYCNCRLYMIKRLRMANADVATIAAWLSSLHYRLNDDDEL